MPFLQFFLMLAVLVFMIVVLAMEIIFLFIGPLNGAPYVPSKKEKIQKMIEIAELKTGERILDLGSGAGQILIAAAQKGCSGVGYEINPFLVWFSRLKIKHLKLQDKLKIYRQNIKKANIGEVDVVFIYLLPGLVEKIKGKLSEELKNDARIICNTFPIKGWVPEKESDKIFTYRIKK